MNKLFLILAIIVVGSLVALQGAINAQLGRLLTHPLHASLISFLGGVITLIIAALIMRTGLPTFQQLSGIPAYLFIGGILGAIFVSAVIVTVPKIGIANVLIAALAGQLILSLIIDHFGWLGVPKQPVNIYRIIGSLMVVAGLFLVNKK